MKSKKRRSTSDCVLIADHGRSGQGWLSYMLCYILNARFIEPYDLLQGRKYTKSDHILRLTQGSLKNRKSTPYSLIVKTHAHPASDFNLTDNCLYMIRDPRDVSISAFFRYRLQRRIPRNLREVVILLSAKSKVINLFVTYARWRRHFRAWKRVNAFIVRYEDLHRDTYDTLCSVLEYLGVSVPDSHIRKAVDLFSFERITGRKKGEENTSNAEFRKGIIGDYKNHFSSFSLWLFDKIWDDETKAIVQSELPVH